MRNFIPSVAQNTLATTGEEGASLLIMSEIRFLREALSEALTRDPRVACVAMCSAIDAAVAQCSVRQPDIILLDATFHEGVAAVRRLRRAAPSPKVVVFAVAETPKNIITWAEAGVAGYVPQTAALVDLAGILISILRGHQVCSAAVAAGLIRHVGKNGNVAAARVLAVAMKIARRSAGS